jgi:hypothetical protein
LHLKLSTFLSYCLSNADLFILIMSFYVVERVGAKVVECACVIELPELKVHFISNAYLPV